MRFVSPPLLFRKYYSSLTWRIPVNDKRVFLTFDDGPIPEVTPYVLEELRKYNAKATFFCLGDNIEKHPAIFKNIVDEGHLIGNHTCNHLNGWKATTSDYLDNIKKCEAILQSHLKTINPGCSNHKLLFRPPYGRITKSQIKHLFSPASGFLLPASIIMWDALSYDFDKNVSEEKCLKNVIENVKPGSIIVFHDSIKAEKNLRYALPKSLKWIFDNGFNPEIIPQPQQL